MSNKVKVQCRLRSFRGKEIGVGNGTVKVGDDLCVEVTQEQADRLLAGPNWSTDIIPQSSQRTSPAARSQRQAGRPVRRDLSDDPTLNDKTPVPEAKQAKPKPKKDDPPPPQVDEDPVAESGEFDTSSPKGKYSSAILEKVCELFDVESEDVLEKAFEVDQAGDKNGYFKEAELVAAAAALTEKPVDQDGNLIEEWPWPDESMPLDYLKRIADAYEVNYASNIGAPKLIERINEAMGAGEE